MIKSEELMVGNMVDCLHHNNDSPNPKKYNIPVVIRTFSGDIVVLSTGERVEYKYLSGIPLTPEILTKWCGFEEFPKWEYFRNGIKLYRDSNGIFYDVHGNGMKIIVFDYLHELQNWYYWNSGKQQLTIKIPK